MKRPWFVFALSPTSPYVPIQSPSYPRVFKVIHNSTMYYWMSYQSKIIRSIPVSFTEIFITIVCLSFNEGSTSFFILLLLPFNLKNKLLIVKKLEKDYIFNQILNNRPLEMIWNSGLTFDKLTLLRASSRFFSCSLSDRTRRVICLSLLSRILFIFNACLLFSYWAINLSRSFKSWVRAEKQYNHYSISVILFSFSYQCHVFSFVFIYVSISFATRLAGSPQQSELFTVGSYYLAHSISFPYRRKFRMTTKK